MGVGYFVVVAKDTLVIAINVGKATTAAGTRSVAPPDAPKAREAPVTVRGRAGLRRNTTVIIGEEEEEEGGA